MYLKLALRNAKRSIFDYLLYFFQWLCLLLSFAFPTVLQIGEICVQAFKQWRYRY